MALISMIRKFEDRFESLRTVDLRSNNLRLDTAYRDAMYSKGEEFLTEEEEIMNFRRSLRRRRKSFPKALPIRFRLDQTGIEASTLNAENVTARTPLFAAN